MLGVVVVVGVFHLSFFSVLLVAVAFVLVEWGLNNLFGEHPIQVSALRTHRSSESNGPPSIFF